MDIQYDPSLSKEYLADLYNNALKHEKNQIKIFGKLLKDTLYYNKISYMNEREKVNEPPLKINNSNKVTIISINSHNSGRPNNIETPLKTNNPDTVPKIVDSIKSKDPKPVSIEQSIISNTKKEESKDSQPKISNFIIIIIIAVFLWNYQKILALIVTPFLFSILKENNDSKICEEIFKDIKNYLRNAPSDSKGIRSISENEIIEKYSEKYKIDHNTFAKEYLKKLKILLKNDYSLRESKTINIQGIVIKKWELVKID